MKKIIIIICCFASAMPVFGQDNPEKVDINNRPLVEVLKEIEKKYELFFSYKVKDLKKINVSLTAETTSINHLLEQLLAKTNLQFEIVEDNFVVIKQKTLPQTNTNTNTNVHTFSGIVFDHQNKTPLPYANILIENTTIGTTSNEDGSFKLSYEFKGDEKLVVSYVGYEAQSIEVSKFKDKQNLSILLKMPKIKEAFLVIRDYLTDGISVEKNGAATNIKPKLIGNMPGTIEPDVLSTIQFLPGVAAPSSRASDIYIRGCTPDQNLVIWEDIPIYHIAHYFGMISSINPFIIKETNVYKGGFNATFGGRIGGVIELISPDEKAYKSDFGIGANMTHAQAYAHQKLRIAQRPSSFTFSLRRSYNEIMETPTFKNYSALNQQGLLFKGVELRRALKDDQLSIFNDFYFLDANFKWSTQITEKDKFQLSGVYSLNDFNDQAKGMFYQTDSLYLINRGVSLKWQHQWNNKVATVVKAIVANDSLNYQYRITEKKSGKSFFDTVKENSVTDRQLVLHNSFGGANEQNWQLGYQYTNYKVNYYIFEDVRKGDLDESEQSIASLNALYAHYQNPIENKIGIQAGIRLSTNNIKFEKEPKKIQIEPRLRLDYKLSKSFSIHSSFGMYHQVLSQLEQFKGKRYGFEIPMWQLSGDRLAIQKSTMYQAGFIFQENNWVVDLQAYHRKVNGISSRAYSIESIPENRPTDGRSNIVGVDVMVKKRIGPFRSWLSYSLSKADFIFKIDGRNTTFPSNYDQRHIVDWSNQLRLNNWQISASYKICSGLPYTEMTGFKYKQHQQDNDPFQTDIPLYYTPIYGPINIHNLPVTSTLNLSINYQLKPINQKWKAHFTAAVTNLLNAHNIYDRSYTVSPEIGVNEITPVDKTSVPFTPNLSVRFEW